MMYTLPFSSWVIVYGESALRYTSSSAAPGNVPQGELEDERIAKVAVELNEFAAKCVGKEVQH